MNNKLLPLFAMGKILKENGAKRASNDSKKMLKEVLENYALELSKRAVELSLHAGRKTVKKSDLKLALKK